MPGTLGGANAEATVSEIMEEPGVDVAFARKKRRTLRSQITTTSRQIDEHIRAAGSRGAISGLVRHLKDLLKRATTLHTELLTVEDREENIKQDELHLRYVQEAGEMIANAEQHIYSRKDEAPSDIQLGGVGGRRRANRDEELQAAQQRAYDARSQAEEAHSRAEELRNQQEAAEEALQNLQLNDADPDHFTSVSQQSNHTSPLATNWKLRQRQENVAPDAWIDSYAAGKLKPANPNNSRSSIKADLEPYSGRALDWFAWIDLFRALVHDTAKAPGEKLALLKRHLRGDCLDVVHGLGGGEGAYIEALIRLKKSCGRRDVMRAAHLQAIEKLELKNDPAVFKRYAEKIRTHFFDLSRIGETATADLIEKVCLRLQLHDRLAWNDCRKGGLETRSLNTFGAWLCDRAAAYQNAYSIAADQLQSSTLKSNVRWSARTNQVSSKQHSITSPPSKPAARNFCFKCEGEHKLEICGDFKNLSVGDRVAFCARHRLCFGCLKAKHSIRFCPQKKSCSQPDCTRFHHPLLHEASQSNTGTSVIARPSTLRVETREPGRVAMGMMRLQVRKADGNWALANVFIDEGSDSTLMRQGFANYLNLHGARHILTIIGAGNVINRYSSQRIVFDIQDSSGEIITISCSTLPSVASDTPVTDWPSIKQRWKHLSDLPVTATGGRVDILIGNDLSHLVAALESRVGGDYEPTATLNRFGWLIRGVVQDGTMVTAVRAHTITGSFQLAQLTEEMKNFCETENYGTEYQMAGRSIEERQAVSILDRGTRKMDIGYEIPITWREGEPDLINNRRMAEDRFRSLLRRFERDSQFEADYRAAMKKTLDQGYASRLAGPAAEDARYFLAHHGVYKGPKLRVVFDAAAPFKGKCLNDAILSGPALQPSLPAVLIQFREGEVAWASDVEAMFSRFRLRPADANFFCFLWKEPDAPDLIVCRMDRLPFGATCSPFIAIHTSRRAAIDAGAREKIVEAVKGKLYVDDYLSSSCSVTEGLEEAVAVERVLAAADLHLQGWISNSTEFTQAIMKEKPAKPVTDSPGCYNLSSKEFDKVLGLVWNTKTDALGFRVDNLDNVEYTRVGITSKVASVFDPLGTAAPLIVKAKIRLRALGLKGSSWAEAVDETDQIWWTAWFDVVRKLSDTSVARCLFPKESQIEESQLHIFCDASEEAYAAVVYVRNSYRDGQIGVHQIKASNKLAPKKTVSVPKLELNAALLGSRLARFVSSCLSKKIQSRFFWTDSSTVRNWIRATASYYQVYVSNRVGEIQTLTEPEEWRFVPGKLNPADEATRSVIEEESLSVRWLNGPEFLLQPKENWPKDLPWIAVSEEMRTSKTYISRLEQSVSDWSYIPLDRSNLSSFLKLEGSFQELVERCQKENFSEDIQRLKNGKSLHSSSHLLQLRPFLGPDNLLRVGGRTGHAKLPYDTIHPPILPSKHPLTEKLIEILHEDLHHVGTDYLLAKVNQHFWIIREREAVKKIRRLCSVCIRERATPASQLIGNLPFVRLDSYSAPFTHVAVDYFRPLDTSPGRNRVLKHYGALFTCLVTRAVT